MAPVEDHFELRFNENIYKVKCVTSTEGVIYVVDTGNTPLYIHKATAFNGDDFWTSIPQGRQAEADVFGPLIDAYCYVAQSPVRAPARISNYPENYSEVLAGKVCPYCGQQSIFTDSAEIFGESYGMIYLCRPCQAWVGVHKGTEKAFGPLGTKELRSLRKQAHLWFDQLASKGIINQVFPLYIAGLSNREKSYFWLAQQLGIKPAYCHIGFLSQEECEALINLCKPLVEANA